MQPDFLHKKLTKIIKAIKKYFAKIEKIYIVITRPLLKFPNKEAFANISIFV